MKKLFSKFYLDKEKDIIVNLYKEKEDELEYILETPNHNSGNLITNLARICGLETVKNENDMKIIKGTLEANLNKENEIVYIFRLGGIKIANIYENKKIYIKAMIPAISKTFMSQTKNYKLPLEKTLVKSYILKKSKFRTDLHTHMNANLAPDVLIALGIERQIKYPLYYIKKLNLKMTKKQEEKINRQRDKVVKEFEDSELKGKYLTRKIDDNTFINFADLILNNIENASYNIAKIRRSLEILKDGQAVFTNLEKTYIYRYVFAKGKECNNKIELKNINKIPDKDIIKYIRQMIKDHKKGSIYEKNNLRQDKLLWIARGYKKQGIYYTEIADTDLTKVGKPAIDLIKEIHEIMPKIKEETGVDIRFLAAIRRIPLTIMNRNGKNTFSYARNIDVIKAIAKSPYVVGSDIIGEEINDISDLELVLKELVKYVVENDRYFTIRIHAGENDSLKDNVSKSIEIVEKATPKGKKIPQIRIGHGLYVPDLERKKGIELIERIKRTNTILEFQLTSNIRLNNLTKLDEHPLKKYLENDVKCVQGTDGCGFYGSDTIDEQLALQNLLDLTNEDFSKMRKVEEEVMDKQRKYFKEKSERFEEFLKGRTIEEAILELENQNIEKSEKNNLKLEKNNNLYSGEVLKNKIKELPIDKVPIVIAGGSFNAQGRETTLSKEGEKVLRNLIEKVDSKKAYFVIGHEMKGYEKAIIDIANELHKDIEVDAIVPNKVSIDSRNKLLNERLNGVRISPESEGYGIYKSFNYEIFERKKAVVIAFDGNSPVSNLVQEAKNGKGKSKIYINKEIPSLYEKAKSLEGYVTPFTVNENIVKKILEDSPEIFEEKNKII